MIKESKTADLHLDMMDFAASKLKKKIAKELIANMLIKKFAEYFKAADSKKAISLAKDIIKDAEEDMKTESYQILSRASHYLNESYAMDGEGDIAEETALGIISTAIDTYNQPGKSIDEIFRQVIEDDDLTDGRDAIIKDEMIKILSNFIDITKKIKVSEDL